MSYTVKYHPEGWRSAKDEPPEKAGLYYCADANKKECGVAWWSGFAWENVYSTITAPVTHWQPPPTPPWEIFPKENTDA